MNFLGNENTCKCLDGKMQSGKCKLPDPHCSGMGQNRRYATSSESVPLPFFIETTCKGE